MASGAKTQSTTTAGTSSNKVVVPPGLTGLIDQSAGVSGDALAGLQRAVQGYEVPQITKDTLEAFARGDYQYGGPGQQQYIDASIRAGEPNVINAFSGRPAGGGLAQTAISQYGQDAFDRLFQFNTTNRLNAAAQLPGLEALPIEMQKTLLAGGESVVPAYQSMFGSKGQSTSTQTQPLYQDPWWKTALGVGMLAAAPFTGGATLGPGLGMTFGQGSPLGGGGYAGGSAGASGSPFFTNPFSGGPLFGGGGASTPTGVPGMTFDPWSLGGVR